MDEFSHAVGMRIGRRIMGADVGRDFIHDGACNSVELVIVDLDGGLVGRYLRGVHFSLGGDGIGLGIDGIDRGGGLGVDVVDQRSQLLNGSCDGCGDVFLVDLEVSFRCDSATSSAASVLSVGTRDGREKRNDESEVVGKLHCWLLLKQVESSGKKKLCQCVGWALAWSACAAQ